MRCERLGLRYLDDAMPGLVKVGFSSKDPDLRASELNHTGSPHPYIVDYEVLTEHPRDIEQRVHRKLSEYREGGSGFGVLLSSLFRQSSRL